MSQSFEKSGYSSCGNTGNLLRKAEKGTNTQLGLFFWQGFKDQFCPLMTREDKQAAYFTSAIIRRKQWFRGKNSLLPELNTMTLF